MIALGTLTGYILLAAAFLVNRDREGLQPQNWRILQATSWAAYGFFVLGVILLPLVPTPVSEMWLRHVLSDIISGQPYIYFMPVLLLAAILGFIMIFVSSAKRKSRRAPYLWTIVVLLIVLAAITVSIFPYLIPFSITIGEAASSTTSLTFMLYGAAIFIPIIIIYNLYVRRVFGRRIEGEKEETGY